jgi:hypothetical protein
MITANTTECNKRPNLVGQPPIEIVAIFPNNDSITPYKKGDEMIANTIADMME